MRHNKKFNHLSRKASHRNAMLSNMASSLIMHKRINTTVAKAKALRIYVEPLITKSKDDTTHSRRVVFAHLQNKEAVSELFREVAVKVGDRPGGYTRILKTGNRLGDNAEMCIIELVDYNTTYVKEAKADKPQTRRTRRGGAASAKVVEPKAEVETKAQPEKEVEVKEEVKKEAKAPKEKAEEKVEEKAPKAEKKTEAKEEPKAEKKAEAKEEAKAEEKEEPKKDTEAEEKDEAAE